MSGYNQGKVLQSFWARELADRADPKARALAARLRRASPIEALCEPEVMRLAHALNVQPYQADRFASLVKLLAEVRDDGEASLAKRLGGTDPVLSKLRFQRLMRAEAEELDDVLRRAIQMADRKCDVEALSFDIWHWGPKVRVRWCFDYYGADAPLETSAEN